MTKNVDVKVENFAGNRYLQYRSWHYELPTWLPARYKTCKYFSRCHSL